MTIFLKNKVTQKEHRENPECQRKILEMITLHLPERHLRDYIEATRIYYDYNYEDSKAGFGISGKEINMKKLPFVIKFEFNGKKITLKSLWN